MKNFQEINNIAKEVFTILVCCDSSITEKIPSNILKTISDLAAESDSNFYIDKEKDLLKQNISEKSKDLIALLYYSYIANENEKNDISKIWDENEKKYQKELSEKYNLDNIFKKTSIQEILESEKTEENTSMQLIEYKESFFIKLKKYVFKILHIKANNK